MQVAGHRPPPAEIRPRAPRQCRRGTEEFGRAAAQVRARVWKRLAPAMRAQSMWYVVVDKGCTNINAGSESSEDMVRGVLEERRDVSVRLGDAGALAGWRRGASWEGAPRKREGSKNGGGGDAVQMGSPSAAVAETDVQAAAPTRSPLRRCGKGGLCAAPRLLAFGVDLRPMWDQSGADFGAV